MEFLEYPEYKIYEDIDTLGLPQIPRIPRLVLCLHFPGTEGWYNHWKEFNKQAKEFHQSMVDFNWRILEWYYLKFKQLDRFGQSSPYIAGTILTGPRSTFINTITISDGEVLQEVRKCVPSAVEEEIKYLERTGYKLFLAGKIFIFNDERIVAINYENESEKICYKNCLKFSFFHKNEKVNVAESFRRVYGGLKFSFLVGGLGGVLASYLMGYFDKPLFFLGRCCQEKNMLWYSLTRFLTSATLYTIIERMMLLKFSSPRKYIVSGSSGMVCGVFFGICDNCNVEKILSGATEFGIFSMLCNLFADRQKFKSNRLGVGES